MPETNRSLSQCVQQSCTDNSGKRHRIGKEFGEAIEQASDAYVVADRICEPVQIIDIDACEISISTLADIDINSLMDLKIENDAGRAVKLVSMIDCIGRNILIKLSYSLEPGYYHLEFYVSEGGQNLLVRQLIICAPQTAWQGNKLQTREVLAIQLYALKSSSNWGIGALKALAGKAQNAEYGYIAIKWKW